MTGDKRKEYIITVGMVIKIRNEIMKDGYHNMDVLDRMVNTLCSHPATAALDKLEKWIDECVEIIEYSKKVGKAGSSDFCYQIVLLQVKEKIAELRHPDDLSASEEVRAKPNQQAGER